MPVIRIWQPAPLTAPRQRLIHTNPRSAACAISTAQDYESPVYRTLMPNVLHRPRRCIASARSPVALTAKSSGRNDQFEAVITGSA